MGTTMVCAALDNWASRLENSACAWGGAVFLSEFSVGNCGMTLQHLPLHCGIFVLLLGTQQGIAAAVCCAATEQIRVLSAPRAAIGHAQTSVGKVSAHSANKAITMKGKRRHCLIKCEKLTRRNSDASLRATVPSSYRASVCKWAIIQAKGELNSRDRSNQRRPCFWLLLIVKVACRRPPRA